MNCEQGDIAMIVRSFTGKNAGKTLTCLKFHSRILVKTVENTRYWMNNAWETDRDDITYTDMNGNEMGTGNIVGDAALMPIGKHNNAKTVQDEKELETCK